MTFIYLIATICPSICLQVRRLHDVGKSGSWWWLKRVPIANLYIVYLNCKASEPAINAYGAPENYVPTDIDNEDEETDCSNKIRFCRKCGNKLLDGARFCNKCGAEVLIATEE